MIQLLTQVDIQAELWNQIAISLIAIVGAVLTAATTFIVKRLGDWLKQKTNSEALKQMVDSTLGLVKDVVISVNQTFVDDLVKSGEFTKEAQQKALDKALEQSKQLLSEKGKELLIKEYGNLDTWLKTVIEAKVKEVKQFNK